MKEKRISQREDSHQWLAFQAKLKALYNTTLQLPYTALS